MSNDSMYFDPASFDFSMLKDVVEHEAPPEKELPKVSEIGPDGGAVEDTSDLADLFLADEDEPEEAADPNDDASDLVTSEVDPDIITIFNDLPDDAVVVFGNREMPKAKANEYLNKIDEYENNKEIVGTAANSIDQIHRFIMQDYHKHKTVFDLQRENMERELGTNINQIRRGEIALNLQSLNEAETDLQNRTKEKMQLLDIHTAETTRFRINQTDQAMRAEVPQWEQLKGGLLKDMQDRGINLAELEKVWSKDVALAFLNDYRYRKQKEKAGATALEAAKAKAPRSTSTAANAQRQKSLDANAAKKAELLRKARNGGLDRDDHAKLFEFLVD
ncbi:hypothetical protein IHX65_004878 [Salmonella enterica]|nr:hypothetical protein [Salmonella enterica]